MILEEQHEQPEHPHLKYLINMGSNIGHFNYVIATIMLDTSVGKIILPLCLHQ